jgi:hypothetical protein
MIALALFLALMIVAAYISIVKREDRKYNRYMQGDKKIFINAWGKLEEHCEETEKFYH